jgi:hypothetical protein
LTLFSKTTEGLIKAMGMVMTKPARDAKKRAEKKRFIYAPFGHAVHGKHYLDPETRADIDFLTDAISKAKDAEERKNLLAALRSQPVKFVPVKRAERLDYSRYGGADIRAINKAGGGPKEKARAAKRLAAMLPIKDDAPALAAA